MGKIVGIEPSDYSLEERIAQLTQRKVLSPGANSLSYQLPEPIAIGSGLAQKVLKDDRNCASQI